MTMKINYENSKLTISGVPVDLLKRIIQTVEAYEAGGEEEQKAEEWRILAKEGEESL
jgi:hypothetical protein